MSPLFGQHRRSDAGDQRREVLITGLGIVSPIGIGREAFAGSLMQGRGGIGPIHSFDSTGLPVQFGGEVLDFDSKRYVKPRKSLKVMSRDIQFSFAAADMAMEDAGLGPQTVEPERMGVVFGADMILCELTELASACRSCLRDGKFYFPYWGQKAMSEMFPLLMLKYLPNMSACHVAISHDARGPNNSILLGEVSSLLAVSEAMRVIERGQADVMIAGGSSSRLNPMGLLNRGYAHLSRRNDDPAAACRPFDADRDGMVYGEGAAAFILESREHAELRGARALARINGYSSTFQPPGSRVAPGTAIRNGIKQVLRAAELTPEQIGHVNAHGVSQVEHDAVEAAAIRDVLGDVPVTAPKSFFGNCGAATGALEMAASVVALAQGELPVTLNYQRPDPHCPVNVVHGRPRPMTHRSALLLNQAVTGQAAAMLLTA